MYSRIKILGVGLVASLFIVTGCGKKVTRIDPNSSTDLSGKWNDTDSRLVAEEMINNCLSSPWYNRYSGGNDIPRVIVGQVRNRSHEHINVQTFVKDIERTLLNSGKVEFVATSGERVDIRREKADQMENATDETAKPLGNESGADLMLIGTVNTIADQEGNKRVMYYQVDMELIEILTNRKVWIGDKKIKKYISRSNTKF